MPQSLKKYIKLKPSEKRLQAFVDAEILAGMYKAAKTEKLKFKKAVEIALKMFIDSSNES